ncbi:malate synthase-domain-containing protein [Phakopsora pachyrhizi]|uniref:Malate synthase-domain-containing protein n=1 Tax=Phakopsora pachyrhizi TaxID=170000 RepID=A0AAV0AV42_PHAPC|nr:malate synthase-domain-containing protein [Phakopsora pachyrhizi]CAH7672826.1 malate synthase-domain-containing protein [Phakopsora pachyrhizi]
MSLTTSLLGVKLLQEVEKVHQSILTPEAIKFLATLHRYFEPTRRSLLKLHQLQQACLDAGGLLDFNPQTSWIRKDLTWQAASPAPGLSRDDWPVDRKMVINALNSGAATYMADFKGLYTTLEKSFHKCSKTG